MTDEPTPEEMEAVSALLRDPTLWAEPSPDVEDRILAAIAAEISGIDLSGDGQDPTAPFAAGDRGFDRYDPAWLPPRDEQDRSGPADRLRAVPTPDPGHGFPPATPDPGHGFPPATPDPGHGYPAAAEDRAPVVDLAARRSRRRLVLPVAAAAAVVAVALAALSVLDLGSSADVDTVALAGAGEFTGSTAVADIEHLTTGDRIVLSVENLPPAPEGYFYAAWVIEDDPALRVGAGTFHMQGATSADIELWSGVSTERYRTLSVTLQSVDDPSGPGEPVLKGQLG